MTEKDKLQTEDGVAPPEGGVDISLVVPAYNEAEVLPEFLDRTAAVLDRLPYTSEIVFINDGSQDDTLAVLLTLQRKDPRVVVVDLSRNYGKEVALTAGLDYARGEAAVPIDADLQDPPELIPAMIDKWKEGFDVVYARRLVREGESWLKNTTADMFYRVMQRVGDKVVIPRNVGDFRLIDRKALDALKQLREQHRFMKGLFTLVGYRQVAIDYNRDPRHSGTTKFNYWRLWNFSLEGITSFTTVPLRVSTYLGVLIAFLAFAYGIMILLKALFVGDPVAGFPSLFVMVTFLGGIQLVFLGIIGEYLGRIFNETKNRPLYFVQDVLRLNDPSASGGPARSESARVTDRSTDPTREER